LPNAMPGKRSRMHTLRKVDENSDTIVTVVCYRGLPPSVLQSLVEFCGLKCVCEARQ